MLTSISYRTYKGHLVGHIIIEPIAQEDEADSSAPVFHGRMRIPFKNENLICEHTDADGSSKVRRIGSQLEIFANEEIFSRL